MGKTAEELRDDIELRREHLTRDFDAIGDRVSPNRIVERRTKAWRGRVRNAKESIMGRTEEVTGAVGAEAGELRDRAGEVPTIVRHQTEGNPLAAGLIAFGAGLLVATVLPETRRERRLAREVQPHLEGVARSAMDSGRSMAGELKPAVQESAQHVQEAARASAARVTDEARGAAQHGTDDRRYGPSDAADTARR
jgi:hypothetical protein